MIEPILITAGAVLVTKIASEIAGRLVSWYKRDREQQYTITLKDKDGKTQKLQLGGSDSTVEVVKKMQEIVAQSTGPHEKQSDNSERR
jgi:hypothetical protein